MTVLNEFTAYNYARGWFICFAACMVLFIVLFLWLFFAQKWFESMLAFVAALTFFGLAFFSFDNTKDVDGVIHTKCHCIEALIDDSVTFNEVTQNYKILGTRGDVFILEMKDTKAEIE